MEFPKSVPIKFQRFFQASRLFQSPCYQTPKSISFLRAYFPYINQTFYTELNKKLQIYGLVSTSAIGIESTIKLVRPENSLKFNVVNDKYMDHIVLQLEDIRKPGQTETKGAKVTNFSIL